MAWTTTDLLAAVRRDCRIPDGAHPMPDADILATADEQIRTSLVPLLHSTDENYLVKRVDLAIVPGTSEYRIPSRATAGGLRDVWIVDPAGNQTDLVEVDLEDMWRFQSSFATSWSPRPLYCIEGDKIVIPTPTVTGYSLRVRYYFRPSRLVLPAQCAVIVDPLPGLGTGIVLATNAAVIEADANFVSDIVQALPNFDTKLIDGIVTVVTPGVTAEVQVNDALGAPLDITTTDITFDDFICNAGETCVPQVPDVLHALLAKETAAAVASALGQMPRVGALTLQAERERAAVLPMLARRNTGGDRKIINRHSPLRQARRRWR
jgi:hypothetical protein